MCSFLYGIEKENCLIVSLETVDSWDKELRSQQKLLVENAFLFFLVFFYKLGCPEQLSVDTHNSTNPKTRNT